MSATGARRIDVPGTRFSIRWVDRTGSTNDDLLAEAAEGAPEGEVLVADEQTSGRGRLARRWEAPKGSSLLLSVLLRPRFEPSRTFALVAAAALSMAEAIEAQTGVPVRLKWPNDLLLGSGAEAGDAGSERKVGGVLAETLLGGGRCEAVVVGIGVNCNWQGRIPPHLRGTAVSLDEVAGSLVDRERLAISFLSVFDGRVDLVSDETGAARVVGDWKSRCSTLGRRVEVHLPAGTVVSGMAVDVEEDGRLILRDSAGESRKIAVGDVVHLRASG